MTGVYLLHFDNPIAPGRHTTQHYTGSTTDLRHRLEEHRQGQKARLTAVARERGIGFVLARFWSTKTENEARALEKRIKAQKNAPRLCPICSAT